MSNLPKLLESTAVIRFQDCDPFNHLNNAEYINYLINAREDQLIESYDLNIYQLAQDEGVSWLVLTNQIAYLKPALLMETVTMQSQVIGFHQKGLTVELKMWDQKKQQLKALMWSQFVHYNLRTQRSETHTEQYMTLFKEVLNPVPEQSFQTRIAALTGRK